MDVPPPFAPAGLPWARKAREGPSRPAAPPYPSREVSLSKEAHIWAREFAKQAVVQVEIDARAVNRRNRKNADGERVRRMDMQKIVSRRFEEAWLDGVRWQREHMGRGVGRE